MATGDHLNRSPTETSGGSPSLEVGVDVGGTFTDLVLIDPSSGAVTVAKVPTSPENQAFGVLAALADTGRSPSDIAGIVHGTTATTNALLERKVARAGLITTRGFRDVLELGRRTRPTPYGLTGSFTPLIPRDRRLEVAERMDASGTVLTPLDEDGVEAAAITLLDAGAEAIVIHFLHAYANPAHERRAAEIVTSVAESRAVPLHVVAGHTVVSEFREYERGTTAAVNAVIRPVLARYLDRLTGELKNRGFPGELLVMQGNGGTVSAPDSIASAVNTVMSGPASGVMAAAHTARAIGLRNAITYDMGGTSTDVGVIVDGTPRVHAELELEYGMPIHVPMVDVHAVGAGGGSIASVDEGGLLRVGPESAGARPGPICYGRGGAEPTITDANLLLGRLTVEGLLAVDAPPALEAVAARIDERIGRPLGLETTEAAAAILRIANDKMAGAIRVVSLERGHDPRDFALFAFGGAGPLHATALARELAVPEVVIPARPGITNAIGCVVADLRRDLVRTINTPLSDLAQDTVGEILRAQQAEGEAIIRRQGVTVEGITTLFSADMQFLGQSHILSVPLPSADISVLALQSLFEAAYWERFAVDLPEIRAVLVNLHTAVLGQRRTVPLDRLVPSKSGDDVPEAVTRPVWFEAGGWLETPILDRGSLGEGDRISGPAIIRQLDTTIVVEPGQTAVPDRLGNLRISVPPAG